MLHLTLIEVPYLCLDQFWLHFTWQHNLGHQNFQSVHCSLNALMSYTLPASWQCAADGNPAWPMEQWRMGEGHHRQSGKGAMDHPVITPSAHYSWCLSFNMGQAPRSLSFWKGGIVNEADQVWHWPREVWASISCIIWLGGFSKRRIGCDQKTLLK